MKRQSRRKFLKTLGSATISAGSLSLLSGLGMYGCKSVGGKKPNIIFIMADDLGYSELGCYGQKLIQTPNVDRMAAEGMHFTDFYSSSAVCAPARCSLMTGKHGGHAYVRDNFEIGEWDSYRGQLPLPDGMVTLASVLKSQGYAAG